MKQGFFAYWWRVTKRASADATAFWDKRVTHPVKMAISLVFSLVSLAFVGTLFGHTVGEKILTGIVGFAVGIAFLFLAFLIFILRTPWKMEDELTVKMEADSKILRDKIDDLGAAMQTLHGKHAEEIESLIQQLENKKSKNRILRLDVERWVLSGQKIFDKLESHVGYHRNIHPDGFSMPLYLENEVIEWQNQVDVFVDEVFPNFKQYVDRNKMPPFEQVSDSKKDDMFNLFRREIGVRIERLKEKMVELAD